MDFVYYAILKGSNEITNEPAENTDAGWFSLNEILDKNFDTYDDVRMWTKFVIENFYK